MCGIVGIISPGNSLENDGKLPQRFELSLRPLEKRGPDECNAFPVSEEGAKSLVVFGQTLLAISDPALEKDQTYRASQPMYDRDLGVSITFNGQIYNYEELRDELELEGHVFDTDGDTEVLLKAYCEWGRPKENLSTKSS